MAFVVLITWSAAVLAGLYMLAVWLIENDITVSGVTASRLPVPVVFGHLTLAVCGLGLWVTYLVLGQKPFAWAAIGALVGIALLGFTMFARWIPVYRQQDPPAAPGQLSQAGSAGPAEGNFPVAIVAAHGLFAVTTLVLAILSALSSSVALSARRARHWPRRCGNFPEGRRATGRAISPKTKAAPQVVTGHMATELITGRAGARTSPAQSRLDASAAATAERLPASTSSAADTAPCATRSTAPIRRIRPAASTAVSRRAEHPERREPSPDSHQTYIRPERLS